MPAGNSEGVSQHQFTAEESERPTEDAVESIWFETVMQQQTIRFLAA